MEGRKRNRGVHQARYERVGLALISRHLVPCQDLPDKMGRGERILVRCHQHGREFAVNVGTLLDRRTSPGCCAPFLRIRGGLSPGAMEAYVLVHELLMVSKYELEATPECLKASSTGRPGDMRIDFMVQSSGLEILVPIAVEYDGRKCFPSATPDAALERNRREEAKKNALKRHHMPLVWISDFSSLPCRNAGGIEELGRRRSEYVAGLLERAIPGLANIREYVERKNQLRNDPWWVYRRVIELFPEVFDRAERIRKEEKRLKAIGALSLTIQKHDPVSGKYLVHCEMCGGTSSCTIHNLRLSASRGAESGGCRLCRGRVTGDRCRLTLAQVRKKALQLGYRCLTPEAYQNNRSRLLWRRKTCGHDIECSLEKLDPFKCKACRVRAIAARRLERVACVVASWGGKVLTTCQGLALNSRRVSVQCSHCGATYSAQYDKLVSGQQHKCRRLFLGWETRRGRRGDT